MYVIQGEKNKDTIICILVGVSEKTAEEKAKEIFGEGESRVINVYQGEKVFGYGGDNDMAMHNEAMDIYYELRRDETRKNIDLGLAMHLFDVCVEFCSSIAIRLHNMEYTADIKMGFNRTETFNL